ncbi:hypothetical protein ABZP36_030086 [Zizania latifolia]
MVTMAAATAAAGKGRRRERWSVVAELEGALLRDAGTFPYFMLVAFEASGLPRFAALLVLWPALRLMEMMGRGDLALRCAAFVATAGVPRAEVEAVARAVLPKFMADDVDPAAWAAFGSCGGRRVVVTRMPRVMVERFAREHLGAHEVVGCELEYSRIRRSTGIVRAVGERAVADRVRALFANGDQPDLGMGRSESATRSFLPFCKEQVRPPFCENDVAGKPRCPPFRPVIFHDGRLVCRPTPRMALVILLWLPLGVLVAFVRIAVGISVPIQIIPRIAPYFGGAVVAHGTPPPALSDRIVPVAMNYRVGLFHPTTARGWKAMDPIFFFMNPRPVYEVTFLNQLPAEETCAAGKSAVDVANYVQRILAANLGFECTSLTRKDKYRILAGNDGVVNAKPATAADPAWQRRVKEVLGFLLHIH